MGQRLVIQIEKNEEALANAYYHWSAYTESAIELTNEVLDFLEESEKNSDIEKAVEALYKTGARFAPNELANMTKEGIDKSVFSFAIDDVPANRNDGLISVSKNGMNESLDWSEGTVYIDIDTGDIGFGVICSEPIEDWRRWRIDSKEDIDIDKLQILEINDDFEFTPEAWNNFCNQIKSLDGYYGISPDKKTVYDIIA